MSHRVTVARAETHYYVILPDDEGTSILMTKDNGGYWSLPKIRVSGMTTTSADVCHCETLIQSLSQLGMGSDFIFLRFARSRLLKERDFNRYVSLPIVLFRGPREFGSPPGAKWITRREVGYLNMVEPFGESIQARDDPEPVPVLNTPYSLRFVLHEFFSHHADGTLRPNIVPWFQRGWFLESETWIKTTLRELRNPVTGKIVQIRSQNDQMIIRVPTKQGDIYFKSVLAAAFQLNEPFLTRELSRMFGEYLPKVISAEPHRRWMLTIGVGRPIFDYGEQRYAPMTGELQTSGIRNRVLSALFDLQMKCMRQVDRLADMGVPRMEADRLDYFIDILFRDQELDRIINPEEVIRLRGRVSADLKNECSILRDSKIPQTLVHGDLDLHNIAMPDGPKGRVIFLNWQDSVISHPFFDAIPIIGECTHEERDAYLKLWETYAPLEQLRESFASAEALKSLMPALKLLSMYKCEQVEFKESINESLRARIRDLGCCYYPPIDF